MSDKQVAARRIAVALSGAASILAMPLAWSQSTAPASTTPTAPTSTASPTSVGPLGLGNPADPNPYYIGVGEAITHDSNVYRVPGGRSDNLSSTSVRAGFLQPIGRQQLFGAASVSVNRYQDATTLNNTSYSLTAGANWETLWRLSGDLTASLNRNLSAPLATPTAAAPVRNESDSRNVDASVRWGGRSLLTLEANGGWSSVDYSGQTSGANDSRQSRAGLTMYFRPGGPLTLGLGGRFNQTVSPRAVSTGGTSTSNTVDGRNVDFLVGYQVSGFIDTNARISYTKQTSDIAAQDFSGLTGGFSVNWRPTGKTGVHFDLSREAGSDTGLYGATPVASTGTTPPATGAPTTTPGTTPGSVYYENSRVTDSLAIGATHATTAKIGLHADARYSRARIVAGSALTVAGTPTANTVDASKTASIGATYAINRSWNLGCDVGREWRDVSGGLAFAYRASTISCSTQLTLR